MQKITPCLWFDNQAEEAANFYTSIFKNSKIGNISRYGKEGYEIHGREAGTVMTVDFEIEGEKFTALNGGPLFKFTPAISFLVDCKTKQEVDALWEKLSQEGTALMELGEYPFSKRYGWTSNKDGISWQIVPEGLSELVGDPTSEKSQRAMKAMLQMKKIDIEKLKWAYKGEK